MGYHHTSPIPSAEEVLRRVLLRIEDPSARKAVIMAKWQRGEITGRQAEHLIRGHGLESA